MQKSFVDKWWVRIALVVAASFFGDQLSPDLGAPFAFVMGLLIVIRITKLKPMQEFKKIKSSRVVKRTKSKIDTEINDLKERGTLISGFMSLLS